MSLLYSPIKIRSMIFNSRLVMPPMATEKSEGNGEVSQRLCDYYADKTKGGYIGLVITEHSYVSPEGKASKGQLSIAQDSCVDGLKKLVSAIHKNNTKVIAQISHAGGAADPKNTGCTVLSASSVGVPGSVSAGALPKEMTQQDIDKLISDFAHAAKRAKDAGFDGVEIHSAHGYLLNQFYSPITNKRADCYTGSTIEGRTKLHIEIINAVRETVGEEFPIALRLGACDYMDGGSTLEDGVQACMLFEKAGIDLLDISGGLCGFMRPGRKEEGYFSELTQAITEKVSVPVILTGGIVSAKVAEDLLKDRKADLIGVGRAILKDSSWAKTAKETVDK